MCPVPGAISRVYMCTRDIVPFDTNAFLGAAITPTFLSNFLPINRNGPFTLGIVRKRVGQNLSAQFLSLFYFSPLYMLNVPSQSVDAPRQSKKQVMTDTEQIVLDSELVFLNIREVAGVLRIAPVSVYRLIAKRAIPVYRACRKILFKKRDILDYLERNRKESSTYGGPEG